MTVYLLDTNVVSEETRAQPDPQIERWLRGISPDAIFLSVLTLGELERGVIRLERRSGGPTRRSRELREWMSLTLVPRFVGRILPIDAPIAAKWGLLLDMGEAVGRPAAPVDALLAATAAQHGLMVVTRNTADFQALGVPFLNPWEG